MFRARVAVRRVEASARSRQAAQAHFPESRDENAGMRTGVRTETRTGTGCTRRVCNGKSDPCASIRLFIHRYKYERTRSE